MQETTLNGKLANSLNNQFSDRCAKFIKYHGGQYGINGMPDVFGVIDGKAIYIEGKMLVERKRTPFGISPREGNINGCSNDQNIMHRDLHMAGAYVFMAYYKHFCKLKDRGMYLIPKYLIDTDEKVLKFKSGDGSFDQFFVKYKKQEYELREVIEMYTSAPIPIRLRKCLVAKK